MPASGTRRHVADGVVAGFARGQPDIGQQMQQVRNLRQRHKVKLHVLAGGQVAFAAARSRRQRAPSCRICAAVKQAAGDLGADHLHAGLALAIDPAAEAMRPELIVRELAGEEEAAWERNSSISARTVLSYSCSRICW